MSSLESLENGWTIEGSFPTDTLRMDINKPFSVTETLGELTSSPASTDG